MTPSHTNKGGKRYHYYVTQPSALIGTGAAACRINASEVERIVIDRLKRWLADRRAMIDIAGAAAAATMQSKAVQVSVDLGKPDRRAAIIAMLLARVDIMEDGIRINIDPSDLKQMLTLEQLALDYPIQLISRAIRIRQGKDVRMIVGNEQHRSADIHNKLLAALIAEALDLHQALLAAPHHTVALLADAQSKYRKRSAQLPRIAMLPPDTIARCIAGTQPVSLTTKRLLNIDLPIDWTQQRSLLGIV